ncbi:MAG TPA: bifunctional 5,10-methylenetetrahydrofolate dehydrogenase/5,10-methenyltetrahydrofolate cyclohydrolase [Candidatus Rubrimentiphilum sp.]|nr:bifunctional 5,10-methylenetetrahydrofolate dehydrogenase/5,10-methenyltetrahydrofolate cyclohydrolase [Candidatus Rubrimentiphilum sp.]
MPARILDGRAVADELRAELVAQSNQLRERGVHPRLDIVLVGENDASVAYVRNLVKVGERAGIAVHVDELAENATAATVRERLERLKDDPKVHGVLLQQPLPAHLSIRSVADSIPIHKDVDGTHPGSEFVPATPAAVMLLLEHSPHWPLRGYNVAVLGRSVVVGIPAAMLALSHNATVTILHSKSAGLQPYLRMADVVIAATGKPGLVRGDDIKPGATVIDVGTTLVDGKLKGDVDFDSAVQVAGAITPVPGGVGPVTNIALLRNVMKAAAGAGKSRSRD